MRRVQQEVPQSDSNTGGQRQKTAGHSGGLLSLQCAAGNHAISVLLQRAPGEDEQTKPRSPGVLGDLASDVFGAIVGTETGGNVRESTMHTVAGVSASYASASQHIASRTVSTLKKMSDEQLDELDLSRNDVKEANAITYRVGIIWDIAVNGSGVETVPTLKARIADRGKNWLARSRLTDADLEGLLLSRKVFNELRTTMTAHGGRSALKKDENLRAKVADQFAETDGARTANLRAADIRVYIIKGFGEDAAAWQRVALTRPKADGSQDDLGARIEAAAEGEGGWRLPRVDIEGAVRRIVAANPQLSDEDVLERAVAHQSQHAVDRSSKYWTRTLARFRQLRSDRAGGSPWQPPGAETPTRPDPTPVPSPEPAPQAPSGPSAAPDDLAGALDLARSPLTTVMATTTLLSPLQLKGSVGRNGDNKPLELAAVLLRFIGLGRAKLSISAQALVDAIRLFQQQEAGMKTGDGRIDPGGKTLGALNRVWSGGSTKSTPPTAPSPEPSPDPVAPAPKPDPTPAPGPSTTPPKSSVALPLSGSVGSGGANHSADVAAVRRRLGELGYQAGDTDEGLTAAIKSFQRDALNTDGDGLVSVAGQTHNALIIGAGAGTGASDTEVAGVVAAHTNPAVVDLRFRIESLETFQRSIAQVANEEQGAARDELVDKIGELRALVDGLDSAGLPAAELQAVQTWAHRRLNALSPYYSQGRNVNFLETSGKTRTCNLTCMAMALEALGKGTSSYGGDRELLQSIRDYKGTGKHYNYKREFDRETKYSDRVGEDLDGLRLPDFLQLAMVARNMAAGKDIRGAVKGAWDDILFPSRMAEVAVKFGVSAYVRDGLGSSVSNRHDRHVEAIGGLLDSGAQIVALTPGHFVRVEAITDSGLKVDDPGRSSKRDMIVPWSKTGSYIRKLLVIG
ncbi:hypothetical protein JDV09_11770 [Mycobacterium sp. Y57]|uniref:peptidoglycan-binding domain-containing protein n=1 Tax=Mycolicibacterium xanthum TaxID=2796469 RepID=UPI001C866544|nr:peptidoglycan-binding domain-containing protein [Mycolicibacterium xanthum]MBX7432777.1 hypothetical protein [Mycolicibacterium xanthum]